MRSKLRFPSPLLIDFILFFFLLLYIYLEFSTRYIYTIMSNPRSFSIHGQGLKLNSRADIEPHLQVLRAMKDVEEVHFGGNTLGVEASEAIAEVLTDLKSLKVRGLFHRYLHKL